MAAMDETDGDGDERDEAHQARHQADQGAGLDARPGQADRVDGRQHETDRALTAREAGQDRVDLVGEPPDRLGVIARQPVVEALQHARPVVEQVIGDDGRDQHDRDQIDDRHAAADERQDHIARGRRPLLRQIAQSLIDLGAHRGALRPSKRTAASSTILRACSI